MAWYKTGTVSVTNNSATVTGSGTNFVSGAQVGFGFQGPNGLVYEITAINSSTSLTITPVYGGSTASGQAYAIVPTQGLTAALASDVTDLITDYQTVADNAGAGKFGDGSAASPGIRFVNDQDTGFFKDTANEIAVSVGGTKVGEFTSTGIDGTVIGGTTPAAITATTLTSANDASVNGLTVGRGAGGVSTNTASGLQALYSNTTGSNNTASGYRALYNNTTGSGNIASGYLALYNNTTGSGNIASGYLALYNNTTGSGNIASGYLALYSNTTGSNNTASGRDALYSNTTGSSNTASGYQALYSNTTASNNTASGYRALYSNTTGFYNTASGYQALYSNTTGFNNTASGYAALYSNTTGNSSTASGYQALFNNTTGSSNIASGYRALYSNTTGSNNTASGYEALRNNTTGSGNFGAAFRNSSGSYTPVFDPSTHSNRVVIGHTGVTNAYVQVAWTVVSDARDKTEIETLEKGLDFVNQLNPVSYKFRKSRDTEETDGKKRYGFLAQEVLGAEGNDNVIVDIEDADKLKMTNEAMIPVLVKAIQELKAEIETLKAQ